MPQFLSPLDCTESLSTARSQHRISALILVDETNMWRNENGRWYGREELLDLIWSKPVQQIAKEFGISDVALAKKCKALGIPRPGRGYWARVQFGAKLPKPKLPKASRNQVERIWIETRQAKEVETVELEAHVLDEIAALKVPENRVTVRLDFEGAHKLVRRSRKLLSSGRVSEYGRVYSVEDDHCLDVHVSREALDRTLLIIDAIISALERHRFSIKGTNDGQKRGIYLVRGGVEMSLSAFEKADRYDHVLTAKEQQEKKESRWWSYHPKWDYRVRREK